MNATTTTDTVHPIQSSITTSVARSGSLMEAIGAIATVALAIVGLAGVFSLTMASIATIVIGAAILIEGASLTANYSRVLSQGGSSVEEWGRGLSAEFLGGVTGIVLGILALLGVVQLTLLSVALLVFGATFLFSGMPMSQSGSFTGAQGATYAREAAWIGSGGHLMVGLGAIVLGILAVIGLSQLTLVLVGLLALGASALFSGSAIAGKVFSAGYTH